MQTGQSSLNPYAASYVPLSQRGAAHENQHVNLSQVLRSGSETLWYGHQMDNTLTHGRQQNVSQGYVHSAGAFQTTELSKQTHHHAHKLYASSSHYPNVPEKPNFDEEPCTDLDFLQIMFPDISEESISDVYLANDFDLDAAIDMLKQLELLEDSLTKLPDTLDIGDGLNPGLPT